MLKEYLTNIASTIRGVLKTEEKINAQDFDSKIVEVYTTGKNEGLASGGQVEYDRFWDIYQENGNRVDYSYGFTGRGWNDNTFKPKYDIIVSNATQASMFCNSRITSLKKALSDAGKILDVSKATNLQLMFSSNTSLTEVPKLDCKNSTNLSSMFSWCQKLHTVDELVVGAPNTTFTTCFNRCDALQNIIISGEINNNISFEHSTKLTEVSMNSIVSALSSGVTGKTATFSKTAVDREFEESPGANDGSTNPQSYWNMIIGYKSNWNISLV